MYEVTTLGVATQREGRLADPTLMLRALEILDRSPPGEHGVTITGETTEGDEDADGVPEEAEPGIVAGRPGPEQGTPELGSYEAWRNVIGGILSTAGISGFLGNMAEFYDAADEDTPQWSAFLEAWLEAY